MLKGKDLMIHRIRKSIKGQDLAARIGISQSYVSKMENEWQEIPQWIYAKWIKELELEEGVKV